MLTNNDKITVPQTVALIITTIVGTEILSLPASVAQDAGPDGWILVLLGGFFTFLGSLAMGAVVKKFPRDTFIEISQKVLGKVPAYPLGVLVALYFTAASALITRIFAEVMNAFMLIRTPREFIIFTQMILTVYLIRHGVEPIARIAEVLFPIMIFPIFAMYLIAIPRADFTELLPFLNTPFKAMAVGTVHTITSFLGFEILLVVGPYLRSPGRVYWVLTVSIVSVTLIYVFIVAVVFATMGVEDTKIMLWPAMSIIRTIRAPGGIFERLDALAMALWTIAVFTTLNGLYFAGSLALAHLTRSPEFKPYVTAMFPWVYVLANMPENVLDTIKWTQVMGMVGVAVGVGLPALVLLVSALRRKEGKTA